MKTYFLETVDFIYIFTDYDFDDDLNQRIKKNLYEKTGKKTVILPVHHMADLKKLLSGEVVNGGICLVESHGCTFC